MDLPASGSSNAAIASRASATVIVSVTGLSTTLTWNVVPNVKYVTVTSVSPTCPKSKSNSRSAISTGS